MRMLTVQTIAIFYEHGSNEVVLFVVSLVEQDFQFQLVPFTTKIRALCYWPSAILHGSRWIGLGQKSSKHSYVLSHCELGDYRFDCCTIAHSR